MLIGHLEDIQRHLQLPQVLLQNSQRPEPTIFFAGGSISLQLKITKPMTYGPYHMVIIELNLFYDYFYDYFFDLSYDMVVIELDLFLIKLPS